MTKSELLFESALKISERVRTREVSVREVAETFLSAISTFNPAINAVVTVEPNMVYEWAVKIEKRLRAADIYDRPLIGAPYLAKDLDVTAGLRTTFGSALSSDYVPNWDMTHVARLREAGCLLLGKTNTPEDGTIPNTFNDVFGTTRNPWNLERCAGGSSGGAASAVAAGLAPMATGSDGAGSIRIPASVCGCVGFKPTFGTIPFGPKGIGVMNTIGHLGPITRTVADAAAMTDAMAAPAERDRTSLPKHESLLATLDEPIYMNRVGYSLDLGYATVDAEVRDLFFAALNRLQDDGWPLEEAKPEFENPRRAIDVLVAIEWGTVPMRLEEKSPANYARQTAEVRALADFRRTLSLDDLWAAYETRKSVCMGVGKFFDSYDLLITPTLTRAAWGLDRAWPVNAEGNEEQTVNDLLVPFNLTGDPAITLPIGYTSDGLPVGMQIIAPRHHDARLLQAAKICETIHESIQRRAPHGAKAGSA